MTDREIANTANKALLYRYETGDEVVTQVPTSASERALYI